MQDRRVVWRDGELVPFAEATCHVLSNMAARGSQVFDVLLVTPTADGPCAVGLRQHVTRFLASAELMGMEDVGEVGSIERAVARTVVANTAAGGGPIPDDEACLVKVIAAWTEEAVGVAPSDLRPTVYVAVMPIDGGRPPPFDAPVAVRSSAMPKIPPEILPPSIKVAASYTPGLREQLRSRAEGFDHTVFRTVAGDLAESTTLSMLVVRSGRVLAPPLDAVLDGITRRILLEAAGDLGLPVDVRAIAWDEVEAADELVLTSTTHPVVPVGRLDARRLDAPGPVTVDLGRTVAELLAGRHRLSARWLTPLTGEGSPEDPAPSTAGSTAPTATAGPTGP